MYAIFCMKTHCVFAEGFAANNVLLWGARGMGKSSLSKRFTKTCARQAAYRSSLSKCKREDIHTLPALLDILKVAPHRIIVFFATIFLRSRRYGL